MFFLGNIESKEGVIVALQKVKVVKNWARLTNVKEDLSFIGLASYYHRFVKVFTFVASHVTRLTQKDIAFVWDNKSEESFQNLKILLTSTPILTLPIEGKDFIIYCDASGSSLGDVLM